MAGFENIFGVIADFFQSIIDFIMDLLGLSNGDDNGEEE